MFDGLIMFGNAVVGYLNPLSLALAFGATLLGVVAGCMPGLSATLVITLLTTLTLKMHANQAILVLVCAYNGAIYGGSRTAILLNIPGTAANAAACIDGYQLARQGQAGRAMGIATTGSVVGTLFGLVCLALFTPMLGEVALSFGAFEFFWLALLGVVMSGNVVAADPLKGWLAGFLGLFVAGIGQDGHVCLRALQLRQCRSRRRLSAHSGSGRRLRLLRSAHRDERALRAAEDHGIRLAAAAHHGRAAILAHDHSLRRDRRVGRHPAGRRRGHGGVVVLRDGQAR